MIPGWLAKAMGGPVAIDLLHHGWRAGEVERLERAQHATMGPGRDEVMRSMYGRFKPNPLGESCFKLGYVPSRVSQPANPPRSAAQGRWQKRQG